MAQKNAVIGNNALQEIPDIRRKQELSPVLPRAERNPEPKVNSMSGAYVVLLTMAAVLFAWLCFSYLQVQAQIRADSKEIYALENQLVSLKTDNQVLAGRLKSDVDMDEIYKTATEVLGMVYPDNNETLSFSSAVREQLRQYEDIPRD